MNIAKYISQLATAAFVIAAAISATANAADGQAVHEHSPAVESASQAHSMSEGEIEKVDKDARRLTIKHGPLQNLGMPGMTMVFDVKDAAMLESVKAGDRIQFVAERLDGRFVVTKLNIQK